MTPSARSDTSVVHTASAPNVALQTRLCHQENDRNFDQYTLAYTNVPNRCKGIINGWSSRAIPGGVGFVDDGSRGTSTPRIKDNGKNVSCHRHLMPRLFARPVHGRSNLVSRPSQCTRDRASTYIRAPLQ